LEDQAWYRQLLYRELFDRSSKAGQCLPNAKSVLWRRFDPQIEILREARIDIVRDRMRADDENARVSGG
jgi:hypothetical protein